MRNIVVRLHPVGCLFWIAVAVGVLLFFKWVMV